MKWRCAIKRRLILSLLSLVLIFVLISSVACVPKRTTAAATSASVTSIDSERITALEAKVNQLQAKLASLPDSSNAKDYSSDIAALQSDIDNIYSQFEEIQNQIDDVLAQVDETLAAWEEAQQSTTEKETITSSTTSWDIELTASNASATLAYEIRPSRIKDEDIYDIDIQVTNSTGTALTDVILTIYLLPRDSTTLVSDDTDIYSRTTPMLNWAVDIITKSSGTARRIECTSSKFTVPANSSVTLNTEFELVYQ